MLMGQSILRIHNREDEKKQEFGYKPYGMFGKYNSTDCFAEPVETENELNNFESLFRLERNKQPGFSIVVPFVTEEITINHLAYAAIEQYFYPILEGRLDHTWNRLAVVLLHTMVMHWHLIQHRVHHWISRRSLWLRKQGRLRPTRNDGRSMP
ncbi:MAG: hypothetical protein EOO61_16670 [Hymenobacter sp.]|nr:MAG: hypothetical protein EOO61_16670 [Hymenobacter sp.]